MTISRGTARIDPSIEEKNVRWADRLKDLTPRVESLFARWGDKHRVPSKDTCRTFAIALMVVRDRKDAQPLRQHVTEKSRLAARKSAVALLHHIKPLKQVLADRLSEIEDLILSHNPPALALLYKERFELLTAAEEAVQALEPALREPPIAQWPDRNPIRFIAKKAREAWVEANEGKAPISTDPAGPLVSVVSDALSLIDIDAETETVSAVLRGRRQTKDRTKTGSKNVRGSG